MSNGPGPNSDVEVKDEDGVCLAQFNFWFTKADLQSASLLKAFSTFSCVLMGQLSSSGFLNCSREILEMEARWTLILPQKGIAFRRNMTAELSVLHTGYATDVVQFQQSLGVLFVENACRFHVLEF